MTGRVPVAIVGSGNIGTDLMYKLARSDVLELRYMVGVDPDSDGLARARALGIEASADGVDWLLSRPELPAIVFEATSAYVHKDNAPRYRDAGIRAIDLTPAALGPYVVPTVNLHEHLDEWNVNMVTCGGQATVPMVAAVSRVVDVGYGEIVASIASKSAGPGTRRNIDEFTRTTASAVSVLGGAANGKAIIVINPADPPVLMRDTIYCSIPTGSDEEAISSSIEQMVADVAAYVPGYRLTAPPQFDWTEDGGRVVIPVEVEGGGDYFPSYAGNLDIMTAAAVRVGDELGRHLLAGGGTR
jgi:acetaldehyde dehydrogenase